MLAAIEAALTALLGATKPQRLRRDGRTHLIADPPMTRAEAVQWLWEGRLNPPEERFKPDPLRGQADAPQGRFLFTVTTAELDAARKDFKDRYLSDGPGWTLAEMLRASGPWLPVEIVADIVRRDEGKEFRRRLLPVVLTYPGQAPWGKIVCWVGPNEFDNFIVWELFQYFPTDEQFYVGLAGSEQRGRLIHQVYVAFNNDLRLYVEERLMRPSLARDEIQRINDLVFRAILGVVAEVFVAGGAEVVASRIASNAAQTAEAALQSFRDKRSLFSLSARRGVPTIVVFRGTTMRWKWGDPTELYVHDLGDGIYFTSSDEVAAVYANMKREGANTKIVLMAEMTLDEMGKVLDLTEGPIGKKWDEWVAPIIQANGKKWMVNENYKERVLVPFLKSLGAEIDDFDTIIGHEYMNGAKQFRFKRGSKVHDKLLIEAAESLLEDMP